MRPLSHNRREKAYWFAMKCAIIANIFSAIA